MYKVPLFNPLIFPVKTKFLEDFFSEQDISVNELVKQTKNRIENRIVIDLRMF